MGQFLYFVENVEACSGDQLRQWGLGYAFERGAATRKASNGPGGQSGLVCAGQPERLGFFPDSQEWRRLPDPPGGGPSLWVGWEKLARPGPADLLRSDAIDGHLVTLADQNEWLVPAAFCASGTGFERALPSRMRLNGAAQWEAGDVLPKFAELWSVAQRFCGYLDGNGSGDLTVGEAADLCCVALAVNYRLSRAEVGALELLDDRGLLRQVLNAVIDWPRYLEYEASQKKTGAAPEASGL